MLMHWKFVSQLTTVTIAPMMCKYIRTLYHHIPCYIPGGHFGRALQNADSSQRLGNRG